MASTTTTTIHKEASFIYPNFHDIHRTRRDTRSSKEIEIDNSVYTLLSLYLDAKDSNSSMNLLSIPSTSKQNQSSYWKKKRVIHAQKNWLGEVGVGLSRESLLLEQNTRQNATRIKLNDNFNSTATTNKGRTRSKSVSFNEVVTVIISPDNQLSTQLKDPNNALVRHEEEEDNDVFVDALEHFE